MLKRPVRTAKPPKASRASDCLDLRQLPNAGPAMVADLRALGIDRPQQLIGADPLALYHRLGALTGQAQDPCVLDTFMAFVDFMNGAAARPWWHYTPQRQRQHPDVHVRRSRS